MIYIREVEELARKAGLPRIRSGWWELKPAWEYLDEVSKTDDIPALVRLRSAISAWGEPRTHGYALAATGTSRAVSSVALLLVVVGDNRASVVGTTSIYIMLGLSVGIGVIFLGLFGNNREAQASAWNYLLDQRIDELRAREATAGGRSPLVTGHAEFVALKIGGLRR